MIKSTLRLWFLCGGAVLLIIEVLVALFVQDRFVRPYLGDVLVVVLLYCFVRVAVPVGLRGLPLYLLVVAATVEVGQAADLLTRLGVATHSPLRVIFGTSFAWADLACYAAGAALCAGIDRLVQKRKNGVP